jgi:hypothetical protein
MIKNLPGRIILTVVILSSSLLNVSCDGAAVMALLTSAVAAFKEDKALVEQFVQDVKKVYATNDAAYQTAKQEYIVARGMHERYLDSIRIGTLTGQSDAQVKDLAQQSRSAGAEFLLDSTKSLAPGSATGKILFSDLIHTPPNLHEALRKLPSNQREKVLAALKEVGWRTWDELQ